MDRREKTTEQLNLNGQGLEIDLSHNPVAPGKNGYDVHIIDHLDQKGLIEKYKNHNVNLENIEEVDFVWNGESYAELTNPENHYDWIIASHVIEHTPDIIDLLSDCEKMLKEDDILSLVISDKRFCFDHYRPLSNPSKIIDSHLTQKKKPSSGDMAEYYLNVVSRNKNIAWDRKTKGQDRLVHSIEHTINVMDDVHTRCFTPEAAQRNDFTQKGIRRKQIAAT
jgi:SAM-dependent methyltransferase